MDEKPDQIENRIRQQRDELRDNFNELGSKVRDTFDWRAQFNENTGLMLGVALGGGLLLSALFRGRSNRVRSYVDRPASYESNGTESRQGTGRGSDGLANIKAALVAAAVTRMGSYIEELLPGFQSEYEKTRRRSGNPTDTVH